MAWSKKKIKEYVAANKLVVIAVEIGRSCNHTLMQELTGLPNDHHVLRADNAKSLVDFFKFSSSMLASKVARIFTMPVVDVLITTA